MTDVFSDIPELVASDETPDYSDFSQVPSRTAVLRDPVSLPERQTKIKISLRPMRFADIPGVIAINVYTLPENYPDSMWKIWFNTPGHASFVCEYAGQIVGYAMAIPKDSGLKLVSIAVHNKLRGFGLGTALLNSVQNSGRPVVLQVRKGNSAAISVYTKNGFVVTDELKGYYFKPTEDGLEMTAPVQASRRITTKFIQLYQPTV
jgi:ribosomal-protein-alanine N-acetyltransferase